MSGGSGERGMGRKGPVVAIVQARMGSSRLPGKVLAELARRPLLAQMLRRVRRARRLDAVVIATTTKAADDPVAALAEELGVACFRGPEEDVLARYAGAARAAGAEVVVRLTADCPMIDPAVVDAAVALFEEGDWDYVSNTRRRTYPDGLDVEVFSRAALERAAREARHPFHREHVTPYISGLYPELGCGSFRCGDLVQEKDLSRLRWTVDTADDLARVRAFFARLPEDFSWEEAAALEVGRTPSPAPRVRLRPARGADAALLFRWVNSRDSLKAKLRTRSPIPWGHHLAWFKTRLRDPGVCLWIVEAAGRPIGQCRVERRGDALEVDVFVAPSSRRHGVGRTILEEVKERCAQAFPGLPLVARVRPENAASRRLFTAAGFVPAGRAPDHLILRFEAASDPQRPGAHR